MTDTIIEPTIERIQALELRPGDVLVVTLPADATYEHFKLVEQILERKLPGQQVFVVTNEVDVAAYRPVPTETAGG